MVDFIEMWKPIHIIRSIHDNKTHKMSQKRYEYHSFCKVIDDYRDMYKADKVLFDFAKHDIALHRLFFDEQKNTYAYSFTIGDVQLCVEIEKESLMDMVREIYGGVLDNDDAKNN